jgi:hypothetical protein
MSDISLPDIPGDHGSLSLNVWDSILVYLKQPWQKFLALVIPI